LSESRFHEKQKLPNEPIYKISICLQTGRIIQFTPQNPEKTNPFSIVTGQPNRHGFLLAGAAAQRQDDRLNAYTFRYQQSIRRTRLV
jgi:hypothetical protein